MENGIKESRPITEKQLALLKKLLDEKAVDDEDKQFVLEYIETFDTKTASKWIEALIKLPKKVLVPKPQPAPEKATATRWVVPANIPDGRYAVRNPRKVWVFFRVVTKEDRTNGLSYRVVQKVLGSPGDFRYVRVTADEWNLAVKEISKDPGMHSSWFGFKVGACGVCGSPLTDPESIRLGIGPICRSKYGFGEVDDYEAEAEAEPDVTEYRFVANGTIENDDPNLNRQFRAASKSTFGSHEESLKRAIAFVAKTDRIVDFVELQQRVNDGEWFTYDKVTGRDR